MSKRPSANAPSDQSRVRLFKLSAHAVEFVALFKRAQLQRSSVSLLKRAQLQRPRCPVVVLLPCRQSEARSAILRRRASSQSLPVQDIAGKDERAQ